MTYRAGDGVKKCSYCKLMKPLTEFYHDFSKQDQRGRFCKPCDRLRARERYKIKKYIYKGERYDKKRKANAFVTNAIRRGAMVRQPCFLCDATEKIDAHHLHYDFPDKVVWLCKRHHADVHHEAK